MQQRLDPPPITRGIQAVPLTRIAALARLGLLPETPFNVRDVNLHGCDRDLGRPELIPLEWVIAGKNYAPSAIMALRSRFDYGYGCDVIEVVHVGGSKWGVVRLIKHALQIGKLYRVPVTGEIIIGNDPMATIFRKLGCRLARQRWVA